MLLLLKTDVQRSITLKASRIGKGHFYQSNVLVQITLEVFRQRPLGWTTQDLNHASKLSCPIERWLLRYLMRDPRLRFINKFSEHFHDVLTSSAKHADGKADRSIHELECLLIEYIKSSKLSSPQPEYVEEKLRNAKQRDKAALEKKGIAEALLRKLKNDPKAGKRVKREAEVVFYTKGLSWPEFHPIGSIANDETLDHVLFKLVEKNLVEVRSNPQFYSDLSDGPERFQLTHAPYFSRVGKLWKQTYAVVRLHVLADRKARIFVEYHEKTRIYGNIWKVGEQLILKDIRGKLVTLDAVKRSASVRPAELVETEAKVVFEIPIKRTSKECDWNTAVLQAKACSDSDSRIRPYISFQAPSISTTSSFESFETATGVNFLIPQDSTNATESTVPFITPSDQPPIPSPSRTSTPPKTSDGSGDSNPERPPEEIRANEANGWAYIQDGAKARKIPLQVPFDTASISPEELSERTEVSMAISLGTGSAADALKPFAKGKKPSWLSRVYHATKEVVQKVVGRHHS